MATASLLLYTLLLLLSSLHHSSAQVIISVSSPVDLQVNPSPQATNKTLRPTYPPRGRIDVPIRVNVHSGPAAGNVSSAIVLKESTVKAEEGQRMARPTADSTTSFLSTLSTMNLSSGLLPRPTASRFRTDTASLAFSNAFAKGGLPSKGPTLPPSSSITDSSLAEPAAARNSQNRPITKEVIGDWQEVGSGAVPTVMRADKYSPVPPPTAGNEMPQFRPQAQSAVSEGPSSETVEVRTHTAVTRTVKPRLFAQTSANGISSMTPSETRATLPPATSPATAPAALLTGELTATAPSTDTTPREDSVAVTSPPATTTKTSSANKRSRMGGPQVTTHSLTNARPHNLTGGGTTSTTEALTTTPEGTKSSSDVTHPATKTTQRGRNPTTPATTVASEPRRTGNASLLTTTVELVDQGRAAPTYQADTDQKNRSVPLGHPHQAPSFSPSNSPPSISTIPSSNTTLLYWEDLKQTLGFAWELHVYGSASLFLLLFAGAALGLMLSPGISCPHRGALALANGLLFLAGGVRAALFLIDPYGTRRLLPRPAIIALYNLPLHLLVWAQTALALLALRVAGVSVLPSTVERPPLVAVLAVLQCTLLLAADLFSPALSPAVPITLQVLSLCWGLALCLGFLCYVFPRLRCPAVPHPGGPEDGGRKSWSGSKRIGLILGRVLAVCALLGAVCCGLHVHATLWLFGLLGSWNNFNWGWWLVHFWARLLELAWSFSLLLLGSWVFWRPQESQQAEEGGTADGRAGDLPSPGQSASSTHRHTCWSKIVQSLRGKPCRKSESNGVGGGGGAGAGGAPGDLPNNCAGQERPGADITKSLIRNQNHEQASAQPRCVKDSNRARNQRARSAERGVSDGSTGSLLRLQTLGQPPLSSQSGSVEQDTGLSLYEFDLRPPSPIDLTRSIDEALHREHLIGGGSLFHPLSPPSPSASPGSGISQGPWLRRNSDPQMLSESSEAQTESSMPLGGSIISSVPSRQVTAPPTPSHQGHRWPEDGVGSVPSSVSCPVSLRPSRTSTGHLGEDGDDTRPFITPDSERVRGRAGRPLGSRNYLEVSRQDDSGSVSSEIIDL